LHGRHGRVLHGENARSVGGEHIRGGAQHALTAGRVGRAEGHVARRLSGRGLSRRRQHDFGRGGRLGQRRVPAGQTLAHGIGRGGARADQRMGVVAHGADHAGVVVAHKEARVAARAQAVIVLIPHRASGHRVAGGAGRRQTGGGRRRDGRLLGCGRGRGRDGLGR